MLCGKADILLEKCIDFIRLNGHGSRNNITAGDWDCHLGAGERKRWILEADFLEHGFLGDAGFIAALRQPIMDEHHEAGGDFEQAFFVLLTPVPA